jgi:peptidoglycan/xylan/chitin deacetylase (PgdA/CDA1 family)
MHIASGSTPAPGVYAPFVSRRLPRRRVLSLAAGTVAAGALSAAGLSRLHDGGQGRSDLVLSVDPADPRATPRFYRSANGTDYLLPTATPVPPTATPSPTPSPTPTPRVTPPAWSDDLLRQVASKGPGTKPLVALTIDDGWDHRDEVLEVVKQLKLQLSFFLAGRPLGNDRAFVARSLDAGCEIANHTMDHYDLINQTSAYIKKDIQDFEDLVKAAATGATTRPYMRPSGGNVNANVINSAADMGYRTILWNVSTGDGSSTTTPQQMTDYAVNNARPGSIILMHFSVRAVTALPMIVAGLRGKGLEPVTLTRLFNDA